MRDFQLVYFKILEAKSEGKEPTPADLYRLDKYWQMQGELQQELNKLGEKQYSLLFKEFADTYIDVYNTIAIPGQAQFTQIEYKQAQQMINSIWCADNKSWSQRIWYSTSNLQQCLNDCLTECVVAGRRTSDLRKMLQDAFGATYYQADRLVRTEITHIQTQAAQERYKDYGIKEVEVLASGGKKPCAICSKLLNKRFPINGNMPVPAHPNCRCCIVPVIDTKQLNEEKKNGIISNNIKSPNLQKTQIEQDTKEAINKVNKLQQSNEKLHFYKKTTNHQRHAEELTGLIGDAAWEKYEEMADAFIKKEIDMKDIEGFVSQAGTLFKFQHSTGLFAILSDKGTISTLFIPDEKPPEEYWIDQQKKYRRKSDE